MRDIGRAWLVAVLASCAAVVLLLFPIHMQPGASLWHAAGASVHVLLFAGLAWVWERVLPERMRGWVLWGALIALSAGMEWLQSHLGRSAELLDWLYSCGGAACICGTGRLPWRTGWRWLAVVVLGLFPLAWGRTLMGMECRAFPVLAQPGTLWAGRNWTLNGVQLSTASGNEFQLEHESGDDEVSYPGIFRTPICSDWRGAQSLQTAIYWPEERSAIFAVRVDDRPGNPAYADRFQQEFAVTQGWNSVHIPARGLNYTSGGKSMQLDNIRNWGVFLVSGSPFDYFLLGVVRLEMQQENP